MLNQRNTGKAINYYLWGDNNKKKEGDSCILCLFFVYDFRLTSLTPLAQLWSVKFYWTHSSVQFRSVHIVDLRESTTFCWLLSSVDPYMYIHIWLYPTDISVLFKQSESKRNALCKCGCHTTAGKKCIMMRVFIL